MYVFFLCKFHTFPVTEGNEIQHIYSSSRPQQRKLTHNIKFKHFHMQKDMNFRNTIIIRDFGPRESSKTKPRMAGIAKTMHSLTSAKMLTNKESIYFSRILHFSHHEPSTLINLIQHQPTNHLLGTPSNTFFKFCRPIVIYSDSSTLMQGCHLNCYNWPALNHYQPSYFQRPTSSCEVF